LDKTWCILALFVLFVLFVNCTPPSPKVKPDTKNPPPVNNPSSNGGKVTGRYSSHEDSIGVPGLIKNLDLVSINQSNPEIFVNLAYASSNNFMHEVLYHKWKEAYLQKPVALMLNKAQDRLTLLKPGLHLLVYDAARPLSVQQNMWDALDTIPVKERIKFVSSPGGKSLHNLGCAVDLTVCDSEGIPLDMGAGYDDMRLIAYPKYEAKYLADGSLTKDQLANRTLLRSVMRYAGFSGIPTEWWHFNAYSKKEALRRFQVIETEESINQ
jgi:D-alanyl-D-alanine dipeptidase